MPLRLAQDGFLAAGSAISKVLTSFKSLSSFAIWILMLATVALLIDVEIQYRFRRAAQQNDIVQAGVEYFRRACETSSGIASFFKNQACADLVRRQSQVLGLGITRTGVFIDLLDGFSKIPASYVDLLDRVTRDVMKMSLAPRPVDLLQTGLNGAVDSGLMSFGTSWVAGKALKWVAGNMQLV